jgi:hypothetical protein
MHDYLPRIEQEGQSEYYHPPCFVEGYYYSKFRSLSVGLPKLY